MYSLYFLLQAKFTFTCEATLLILPVSYFHHVQFSFVSYAHTKLGLLHYDAPFK